MKLSSNSVGMLIFAALATTVFVFMALRPAVDSNAMNFGVPLDKEMATTSTETEATMEKEEEKVSETESATTETTTAESTSSTTTEETKPSEDETTESTEAETDETKISE